MQVSDLAGFALDPFFYITAGPPPAVLTQKRHTVASIEVVTIIGYGQTNYMLVISESCAQLIPIILLYS